MPAFQQTTVPNPPTPRAPATAAPPGALTDQQKLDLHNQARDLARQARDMAHSARDAAKQAQNAGLPAPVIAGQTTTGTLEPPINPAMIQAMAENISYALFVTIAVIAIGVPLVRALGRRLGPAPAPPAIPPQVGEQLKRIEHAVESMAIEIERISESQRYLMKRQAGKPELAALPRAGSGGA